MPLILRQNGWLTSTGSGQDEYCQTCTNQFNFHNLPPSSQINNPETDHRFRVVQPAHMKEGFSPCILLNSPTTLQDCCLLHSPKTVMSGRLSKLSVARYFYVFTLLENSNKNHIKSISPINIKLKISPTSYRSS